MTIPVTQMSTKGDQEEQQSREVETREAFHPRRQQK